MMCATVAYGEHALNCAAIALQAQHDTNRPTLLSTSFLHSVTTVITKLALSKSPIDDDKTAQQTGAAYHP